MNDKSGEKRWGIKLSSSLERAQQKPVFTGHEFFVTPSAAAQKGDSRPTKDEKFRALEAIIKANGGQVIFESLIGRTESDPLKTGVKEANSERQDFR